MVPCYGLLVAGLLAAQSLHAEPIYQWRDANGQTHFSHADKAPRSARTAEPDPISIVTMKVPEYSPPLPAASAPVDQRQQKTARQVRKKVRKIRLVRKQKPVEPEQKHTTKRASPAGHLSPHPPGAHSRQPIHLSTRAGN